MLKIYKVRDYVSIDGADWRRVGDCGYRVTDEEVSDKLVLDNASFEEARAYLSEHILCSVWNGSTFFRHKPTVEVHYSGAWDPVVYRKFNTLSYKRKFAEDTNVSFEWMTKHLSADQLIQYLKERGITACPMNF